MSKPISRLIHGVADYLYSAAIAAAPNVIGFTDDETATLLCRAAGGATLLTSLFTRYELGLVKVLPFKLHLCGDVLAGLFSVGAPWLFGFSKKARARNTFVGFGLFAFLVVALTQPDEMPPTS